MNHVDYVMHAFQGGISSNLSRGGKRTFYSRNASAKN